MEATASTTRKKKGLALQVALWSAPFLLLLLLGGSWVGWRIAESARTGTLDLSLGGFQVKVDRGGTPQAPRRLTIGFTIRTPSRPSNTAL